MVVKTHRNGTSIPALLVGASNARRYFPKTMETVELRLDDLRIECTLPHSFWTGEPEIHDPRLGEWLKFKIPQDHRNPNPIALQMVQCGTNTFTLESTPSLERRNARLAPAA